MAADGRRRLTEALKARPLSEPLEASLRAAVLEVGVAIAAEETFIRRIAVDPVMSQEYLERSMLAEVPLATVIAERTGADLATDIAPRAIAASYTAALRVASQLWLRSGDEVSIGLILRDVLDHVASVTRRISAPQPALTLVREQPAE